MDIVEFNPSSTSDGTTSPPEVAPETVSMDVDVEALTHMDPQFAMQVVEHATEMSEDEMAELLQLSTAEVDVLGALEPPYTVDKVVKLLSQWGKVPSWLVPLAEVSASTDTQLNKWATKQIADKGFATAAPSVAAVMCAAAIERVAGEAAIRGEEDVDYRDLVGDNRIAVWMEDAPIVHDFVDVLAGLRTPKQRAAGIRPSQLLMHLQDQSAESFLIERMLKQKFSKMMFQSREGTK